MKVLSGDRGRTLLISKTSPDLGLYYIGLMRVITPLGGSVHLVSVEDEASDNISDLLSNQKPQQSPDLHHLAGERTAGYRNSGVPYCQLGSVLTVL